MIYEKDIKNIINAMNNAVDEREKTSKKERVLLSTKTFIFKRLSSHIDELKRYIRQYPKYRDERDDKIYSFEFHFEKEVDWSLITPEELEESIKCDFNQFRPNRIMNVKINPHNANVNGKVYAHYIKVEIIIDPSIPDC